MSNTNSLLSDEEAKRLSEESSLEELEEFFYECLKNKGQADEDARKKAKETAQRIKGDY